MISAKSSNKTQGAQKLQQPNKLHRQRIQNTAAKTALKTPQSLTAHMPTASPLEMYIHTIVHSILKSIPDITLYVLQALWHASPVVEVGRQGDHLGQPVAALLISVQTPDLLPVLAVEDVDRGRPHVHTVHVDEEPKLATERPAGQASVCAE